MDDDRKTLDDAGYSDEQAIAYKLESYLQSILEGVRACALNFVQSLPSHYREWERNTV